MPRPPAQLLLVGLLALVAVPVSLYSAKPVTTYALCSPPGHPAIHTLHADDPPVECLAVAHGRLEWLGVHSRIPPRFRKSIKWLSSQETVLPGLIDSHGHILQHGESRDLVNLVGTTSIGEVVERIVDFIEARGWTADRARFVGGIGWDQSKFASGQFPSSADLERDPRLAGRMIYLKRVDVHALWISTTLLTMLGDLPSTVPGGLIVRTPSGEPTGVFLDNAMSLVVAQIPRWTDADRLRFLTVTAREILDLGLTAVHDASLSLDDIAFFRRLDENSLLPVRVYGMVGCAPINTFCDVARYHGESFTLAAVKIYTDGALGSWGSSMLADYADKPGERGLLISDESIFRPLIEKGFQVCSHTIGDRANQIILDAYESVLATHPGDLRLRLEHAQIMTVDDIARAGRLGVISSVQPTHATSDFGFAEARVGATRIKGAYAWQSLLKAGSPLALGSDFPVEHVSPFRGIHAAISRTDLKGESPHGRDGWYPAESLTRRQALWGFTMGGAYASFSEHRTGSLEVGKEADFVILDRDLLREDTDVLGTQVRATVVGGVCRAGRL